MIAALAFITTAIMVLVILLPLAKEPFWPNPAKGALPEISRWKRMGLWAIADVDDEYEMGKLSKDDHSLLREQFKRDLLSAMKLEKDLALRDLRPEGKDIQPGLKRKLLYEVVRVCGLKRS